MKKRLSIITGLFTSLLCFAPSVFAVQFPLHDFFKPTLNDKSVIYLQSIFGKVGGELHGQYSLLNHMFKYFNEAMLVLATLIIMYTLFMSIINTAHQGEFLGKKFDSLWVPIRSVAGFAIIIPMPSGYSVIQIFLMWVIIQGVGAADTLWTHTLEYLGSQASQGSGAVISPLSAPTGPSALVMKDVLTDSICMHQAYKQANPGSSYGDDTLKPTSFSQVVAQKDGSVITYEGRAYNAPPEYPGTFSCGAIAWPVSVTNPTISTQQAQAQLRSQNDKYQVYSDQMPGVVDVLGEAARHYIWYKGTDNEKTYSAMDNPLQVSAASLNAALQEQAAKEIGPSDLDQYFESAKDVGWIYAGAYYHYIAQIGNNESGLTSISGDIISRAPTISIDQDNTTFVDSLFSISMNPNMPGGTISSWGSHDANSFLKFIYAPMNGLVSLFSAMLSGQWAGTDPDGGYFADSSIDPIIKIQKLGNRIIVVIESVFSILVAMAVVSSVVGGFCSAFFPGQFVINTIRQYILNPLLWVLLILWAPAITMAVYIPLIPYIIFTFAAIGWMVAVIESMIAAPLVALGICYPEGGSELLGRADPAVMLITNLFLRPSLMLFGLMSGMVLSYVALNLFNTGYSYVVAEINFSGNYGIGPLKMIVYLVIYVVVVVQILNRSFSLIHVVPDRVLNWIQGGAQGTLGTAASGAGAEQSMGAIKGGVSQTAGVEKAGLEKGQGYADSTVKKGYGTAKSARDAGSKARGGGGG